MEVKIACPTEGTGGHLSLRGGLLSEEICIILVCEGLGLNQEVAQVLLESAVLLQLKHARHTRLHVAPTAHRQLLVK